jgi:hypothetical protein
VAVEALVRKTFIKDATQQPQAIPETVAVLAVNQAQMEQEPGMVVAGAVLADMRVLAEALKHTMVITPQTRYPQLTQRAAQVRRVGKFPIILAAVVVVLVFTVKAQTAQ